MPLDSSGLSEVVLSADRPLVVGAASLFPSVVGFKVLVEEDEALSWFSEKEILRRLAVGLL